MLRVGLMMLGAGATSRRVLEAMRHMAAALDLDDMVAQVTTTTIVLTVHRRGIHRTQVGTVARHQIDADRLGATQHMASTLPPHLAVAEANRLMDAVESRPPLYPHAWQIPVAAGLGSLAFLFLNNGSPWEGPAVFIAGALGFAVRRWLTGRHVNQLACVAVGAAVSCLVFALVAWVTIAAGGDPTRQAAGFISSVIYLVPGFPLVTAALNFARLDVDAGLSRLMELLMVTGATALGIWVASIIVNIQPAPAPALPLDLPGSLALWFAATFTGTAAFAAFFGSPLRAALLSGGIGAVANTARLAAINVGMTVLAATAAAALLIGLLCWLVANRGIPRITLAVPTVIPLVPGTSFYRSLVEIFGGDAAAAVAPLAQAVLVSVGIGVGLAAARMLTDPGWGFTRPDPPSLASFSVPRPRLRRRRSEA